MTARKVYPTSSAGRLVVAVWVDLRIMRDPRTRTGAVLRMLDGLAQRECKDFHWGLGPIQYKAELLVPPGVIPTDRPHELDGKTASEATVDALVRMLDDTGLRWTISASAEVIPRG